MYVCVCTGITDHHIRDLAAQGVREMTELTMRTGCGSQCGSCRELAMEILAETHATRDFPLRILAAA